MRPQGVDDSYDVQAVDDLPEQGVLGWRRTPLGPLITKNWLPLVLGPALAMASDPTQRAAGSIVKDDGEGYKRIADFLAEKKVI